MTLVADLTTKQARKVTDDIRTLGENLIEKVTVAYRGRVWLALSYKSWDEWKAGELAGVELPRDVIPALRAEGLSHRAIATVTGLSKGTVANELPKDGQLPEPDRITGLDGKERPSTRAPRTPGWIQEVKDMPPEAREACPYCGQDLPDRLQIPPERRRS